MTAGRDSNRLVVRLLRELRRPDVGHPQLYRSQTLRAESLAVSADSHGAWRGRTSTSHAHTLHVTPTQRNDTRPLSVDPAQNVTHEHRLQAPENGTDALVHPLGNVRPHPPERVSEHVQHLWCICVKACGLCWMHVLVGVLGR